MEFQFPLDIITRLTPIVQYQHASVNCGINAAVCWSGMSLDMCLIYWLKPIVLALCNMSRSGIALKHTFCKIVQSFINTIWFADL
jgi:hypothetical protein